jgi:4-diphosphocytidyl-2-C-methyl-D-erythritol kinase
MELAAKSGADVPFCLVGGTARCLGVGDKVEKINPRTGSAFLLVVPNIGVSTKDVYNKYDEVGAGDSDNDLERSAVDLFPKIKEIRETLDAITRKGWKMSGSGPALFLELMDLSESEKYLPLISKLDSVNRLVKRMDAGVELF